METYNIPVMLKDGSIKEYIVKEFAAENKYEVYDKENLVAVFKTETNGKWAITDNPSKVDSDLEERITGQLNGYRR